MVAIFSKTLILTWLFLQNSKQKRILFYNYQFHHDIFPKYRFHHIMLLNLKNHDFVLFPLGKSSIMCEVRSTSASGSSSTATWIPSGWRTSTLCWTTTSYWRCPTESVSVCRPTCESCSRWVLPCYITYVRSSQISPHVHQSTYCTVF